MKVVVFFDGGGNKPQGRAAGAGVVYDMDGRELGYRTRWIPGKTVNEAEYTGLLLGLELAYELGATEVEIYGDSEVIINQVLSIYEARKDHLRVLRDAVWASARRFQHQKISLAPRGKKGRHRDNNARADELCTKTMRLECDLRG